MRSESHSRGIWCSSPHRKKAERGLLGRPALSPAITGTVLYNPLHKQQQLWEKGLEWLRMLKVRCYRVLSQGDWEYVRNAAMCCSEEQHSILLMKLESHVSRETSKTLIMPEKHQGNSVLTFYFWPWVQRIIFFCFNIWLSTTCQQERKKKLVSIPVSAVSGLNHERRRLLMRLIHIMMYFTSYS